MSCSRDAAVASDVLAHVDHYKTGSSLGCLYSSSYDTSSVGADDARGYSVALGDVAGASGAGKACDSHVAHRSDGDVVTACSVSL